MHPDASIQAVLSKLQAFKKKYYLNQLIRGGIFTLGLLLSLFLVYSLLEYFLRFPFWVRAFLFFSYLGVFAFALFRWVVGPVTGLLNLRKGLTDEEAAQQVGHFFPDIKDKLLNTLQLQQQSRENALIAASIEQKSQQLAVFKFADAIKLDENKGRLKYLYIPLGIILAIIVVYPSLLVESSNRIVQYNKSFAPQAPFTFEIENKELAGFRNEDFELNVRIEGSALPSQAYVLHNGRRQLLEKTGNGLYKFTFKKLQKDVPFQLEGAGFLSDSYVLEMRSRPNLKNFEVAVTYPRYLNKPAETVQNTGNLTVPEGSTLEWKFNATETDAVFMQFENPAAEQQTERRGDSFRFRKQALTNETYSVKLQNEHSTNKEAITYQISTIPDRHPDITVEQFRDTVLFNYMILGGNISDDYGLTRLSLHYRKVGTNGAAATSYKVMPIRFDRKQLGQTYYLQWSLDSLSLTAGDRIEYFVQVWDNDGIRGPKSARTRTLEFKLPTQAELRQELNQSAESIENQLSQSLKEVNKLQADLKKFEEKLKTKKELSWQDKKQLEDLLKQKKELEEQLQQTKELGKQLNQKQERFDERSQELAQKAKELQKLMEQLLDDETKKLYEELEKLLQQEKMNDPDLKKLLEQMDKKENTLENELERALEMFKQLQFEKKLEQAVEKLQELAEKQEKAAEKSEEKNADSQKLEQEQQKLNEEFKEMQKELDQLEKDGKELEEQQQTPDTEQQEESIEQDQQQSSEQLKSGKNQKASKSQKSAADKMKQMADQLQAMQSSMQADQQQENMDDLRDILENLLTLSFDQEELMKNFRQVNQTDPRFVTLSQQQLKLKDDARMIEDSLLSLAKRVFQIEAFVTREVGLVKENIDNSVEQLKERNVPRATNHQQLAMTSINNLALMLNDVLKQMQQQMAQQMKGNQMCSKPGSGKPKPGSMGQMQQQLSQKIQQLKNAQKSGRGYSEELAKLAAEQAALRKALQELEKQMKQEGAKEGKDGKDPLGGQMGQLSKLMEENETDLVNKRITEETIMRQRDILTRLLEAEKSVRERDLDDKREAERGQDRQPAMPPSFEKYLQAKQKQTELLKTISPSMNSYYKQEVNEYFQKVGK